MAGTHKKTGLREPTNGTAKVSTIDGKYLKLITRNATHPAYCVYSFSIRWHDQGIAKCSHPRLSLGKVADFSQSHPRKIAIPAATRNGGKKKTHNRHSQ
jgi:hypothetical protein